MALDVGVVHADAVLGLHELVPSAIKSNTATPPPSRSLMCRGTGRHSLACWAAIPRRIAAQSAGG
eukprot:14378286-Alexandrium_andersonii.AAC.1